VKCIGEDEFHQAVKVVI